MPKIPIIKARGFYRSLIKYGCEPATTRGSHFKAYPYSLSWKNNFDKPLDFFAFLVYNIIANKKQKARRRAATPNYLVIKVIVRFGRGGDYFTVIVNR